MKDRLCAYLLICAMLALHIAGCGGGGDGTAPLAVSASKPIAYANGTDSVAIAITFPKPVTADTTLILSAGNGAIVTPASVVVPNGASTAVTNITVTSTKVGVSVVSAGGGGYAGSATVKFIEAVGTATSPLVTPVRAEVFVSLNKAVPTPGMALLNFYLRAVGAADFSSAATLKADPDTFAYLNEADTTANTNLLPLSAAIPPVYGPNEEVLVALTNLNDINAVPPAVPTNLIVAANSRLLKFNYDIVIGATNKVVPSFSHNTVGFDRLQVAVDKDGVSLFDKDGITPLIDNSNIVVTVDYYDAANNKLN